MIGTAVRTGELAELTGMYLGTGTGAALGGALIGSVGVGYVPVAAALLMTIALALTPRPARTPSGHAETVSRESPEPVPAE